MMNQPLSIQRHDADLSEAMRHHQEAMEFEEQAAQCRGEIEQLEQNVAKAK